MVVNKLAVDDIRQKMRMIPAMDIMLANEWVKPWLERLGRDSVKRIIGENLTALRRNMLAGADEDVSPERLERLCTAALAEAERPNLRRVINAAGVVIHTNLGRSLLAESARRAMTEIASGYCNLEYDLKRGARGQRNSLVEGLICAVTGAEAAIVVNNNAGAVMLALFALASGKEVIVSRGELVEIGGSFRVPDIMELSGAKLREVGTTNRTHLEDYVRAIGENTSMLLKVHPSNFRIEGFTLMPEREELAAAAHERGLIFMEDAGSGLLTDCEKLGLSGETSIRQCIEQGADIVTFSGDKMLGGPQIGVIAGRGSLIARLRKHQMLRALRVDKVTLAAFEATLKLYMRGDIDEIPTAAMIRMSDESMKTRAISLADKIVRQLSVPSGGRPRVEVVRVEDAVGGGSYPERPLGGWGVSISDHPLGGAGHLQSLLREADVPILCGAREDALILHVRTLQDGDDDIIAKTVAGLGTGGI